MKKLMLYLYKFRFLIFLFFSINEILELFDLLRFKSSNFSKYNIDIYDLSSISLISIKFNILIFLFFSKNEISSTLDLNFHFIKNF